MNAHVRLALVVGPETDARHELARGFVARAWSSVVCSGPPGCPLLVEDRCALNDAADVTVFMPVSTGRRDVATELALCCGEAKMSVIIEPSPIVARPSRSVTASSANIDDVLEAIDLAEVRRGVGAGRRARDVADSRI